MLACRGEGFWRERDGGFRGQNCGEKSAGQGDRRQENNCKEGARQKEGGGKAQKGGGQNCWKARREQRAL